MIKNLNEQKANLKENLGKEIDRYFEAFENSSNQKGFDINAIEKLMLENQRNVKGVICNKYCPTIATSQISSNRNDFTSFTL